MGTIEARACANLVNRYRMIEFIEISNFRGFERLQVKDCAPINVIVGENGAGKTALIEAIFLTLCGGTEKGLLLRQLRGGDPQFQGDLRVVVEAMFSEYFYRLDLTRRPSIRLRGHGPEVRSLTIERGRGDVQIPSGAKSAAEAELLSPIIFEWVAASKKKYRAGVKVTSGGIKFESTGEVLPQNWFLYAAQAPVPARENADRFTALRKAGGHQKFVALFTELFDWIEDIFVDSAAGGPMLSATDKVQKVPLPLTAVSGGVNRMAAILLAAALQPKGILLVDEIENGIFYSKHISFCRALLRFAREYECQLFLSSHSDEWLKAFAAATDGVVDDIALWRLSRGNKGPEIQKFSGRTFKLGIEQGAEVRREKRVDEDVPSPSDL
jgi:predicted ATPase